MGAKRPRNADNSLSAKSLDELLLGFITERETDYGRIARFLHDEVGQVLSAVGLQLDALRRDFAAAAPDIEQRTSEIQQMLEPIIGRLRDMSYELNPSVVERAGLHFALERLGGRLQDGFAGTIRLMLDPLVRVPFPHADALYRAAEAAADLAVATPRCTQVEIQLKHNRAHVVLEVRANALVEMELQPPVSALLMRYYTERNGIDMVIINPGERDTIIRFRSPIAGVDSEAQVEAV